MSKEIRRNSWEWLCPSLFVNAGGGAQSYSANSKEIWLSRGNNMPSCNTNHDILSQWKNCSKSSTNQYVLCIPNITYDIGVIIHDKGLVWSSTNAPTKERILYIVVYSSIPIIIWTTKVENIAKVCDQSFRPPY